MKIDYKVMVSYILAMLGLIVISELLELFTSINFFTSWSLRIGGLIGASVGGFLHGKGKYYANK
ncbi:hypothetical protein B8A44_07145 [Dolosigranulum pigrum]|jgi:hypothetical protein|uniref:Uncharacterized protein n=3 Tax=Dolosigranulum TaxID=29393 RepID=H3NDH4_9LACT|nr:hypothetical protein [Dolosigranulum pigrum]EHR34214.1 hypothetical protein HMPREF9703_00485 [Dolosigranulum pigrum ATCC 51524]OOL81633.1 hypothetical protein BWX42_07965 [Dolosigranulum pigrum]QDO90598.1 hypothetical protein FNV33_00450 [Dolosigranulum pigrum]QJS95685.1 hypothetical protein B5772_01420 [Dolosigranulum pigrum]QJS97473.1 hypothetical protein B8A41_02185 [Dolosigranulum pigrum]